MSPRLHSRNSIIPLLLVLGLGIISTIFSSLYLTRFYPLVDDQESFEEIPFQRGMSFTTWGAASYNSTKARDEILAMKAIGVEWVGINVWWTQKNLTTTEIYPGSWTDTNANLSDAFRFIHDQDMKIMFKPMLDTETGQWRSNIEASPEWFAAYEDFIVAQAQLAESTGVELLIIGCEMGNMQVHDSEVRELIAGVRAVYSGLVSYAANHDSFWYVTWWDAVDLIGFDAWFPFTMDYDPSLEELTAVWDSFYERLYYFSEKWDKPIFFPELGIQARDGSNMVPNDNKFNQEQDIAEMNLFYRSLFSSKLWRAPWFKGTYFWMWDLSTVNLLTETGFQPKIPTIQDTIHHAYAPPREVLQNHYQSVVVIFIIACLALTLAASNLVRPVKSREIVDKKIGKDLNASKDQVTPPEPRHGFAGIIGLAGGSLAFWATTMYTQTAFAGIYSAYTYSFFFGMNVTGIAAWIFLFMVLTVIGAGLYSNYIHKHRTDRRRYQKVIISMVGILGILMVVYCLLVPVVPVHELSIRSFLAIFLLGLLASFVGSFFILEHPYKISWREKTDLYFEIILIAALVFIGLYILLAFMVSIISILILVVSWTVLLVILPGYFRRAQKDSSSKSTVRGVSEDPADKRTPELDPEIITFPPYPRKLPRDNPHLSERLKPSHTQMTGLFLVLEGIAIFLVLPRCFAPFTLINFNLTLLPWFFIPIGASLLVGIPLTFMWLHKTKIQDPEGNELLARKLLVAGCSAMLGIILVDFFLPAASFCIGLVVGGFVLVTWISGLCVHEARLGDSNCPPSRVARMITYVAVLSTVAFTAVGIQASFIYIFTFFSFVDGQMFVRTDFTTALTYDVPTLIKGLFMAVSGILIIIILLGSGLLGRRDRNPSELRGHRAKD